MSPKGKAKAIRDKAQGIMEYALLICIFVAAVVAMQVYLKRSIQGRLKSGADELSGGAFYSPGATNSNYRITRRVTEDTNSSIEDGGALDTVRRSISDTNTSINQATYRLEEVLPFEDEPAR